MYTQCPDCSAVFRVTATDLKQAAGKVRCGGCGSAFDALEFLSEKKPKQRTERATARRLPELKPDGPGGKLPKSVSPEESIALLKTLDELAGEDIRIEDTGIEWRVLDDQVISELTTTDDDGSGTSPDDAAQTESDGSDDERADEARYDDDTPVPNRDDESAQSAKEQNDGVDGDADADQQASEQEPGAPGENVEVEFDDEDTGDWEEILDEVDDGQAVDDATDDDAQDPGDEADDEEHDGSDEDADRDDDEAVDSDEQDSRDDADDEERDGTDEGADQDDDEAVDSDEQDLRDDADEEEHDGTDEGADQDNDEDTDSEDKDPRNDSDDAEHDSPDEDSLPNGEDGRPDMRSDEADDSARDDESAADGTDGADALADVIEEDVAVESIIMEGETVRSALDGVDDDAGEIFHWTAPEPEPPPARSTSSRIGLGIAAVLLLLTLGLQLIHYYRETLATLPAIHQLIAPAYRVLGMPLTPDWDVTGWRFEATQGSTNNEDGSLTVFSRIGNTSDKALPYPLIGVSLTDRFDETVGSRLLEPAEFLTANANPRKLVRPGESFAAVISIGAPDEAATGYKLDVCYRKAGNAGNGRLRCAIGDFRE